MITNGNLIVNSYKCTHAIMEYLVYEAGIAILSYDNRYYYFARTKKLESALEKMPWHLKVLASFTKQKGAKNE